MQKALALDNLLNLGIFRTKKLSSKSFTQEKKNVNVILASFLIIANLLVLMSYIFGVNEFSSSGYEIKTLQKQFAALSTENKRINLKVSEAVSMVEIQKDFLSANFISGGTTKFLQTTQLTQR